MYRANYALHYVGAQLAPRDRELGLDWATNAGDETDPFDFDVPTADATDAYVGLQVFDVGTYGHEILINGEPLSGFDIPPRDGWQYWMDSITGAALVEGANTCTIARDSSTNDAFAVGSVSIHWKEPNHRTG
ncbi:DUF7383 domain-containing protein [Haloferacaceae archaeon DSL9]